MIKVDVGIFAHNESATISQLIDELALQDVWSRPELDVRFIVLANGCTDRTVENATAAVRRCNLPIDVVSLDKGGKSRTWNRFVHDLSRPEASTLIFADADIRLPVSQSLSQLIVDLDARPTLQVVNSRPVKDIVHFPEKLTPIDRIIASAGGGLDDWRSAICGQLYAMRAINARRYYLPVGLPVEDGFLRAMVLTDALTTEEDFKRIDGFETFHIYESERSVRALIRHQTRIIIGSAINSACFAHIRSKPSAMRHAELIEAAKDESWLKGVVARGLPKWPFGYIPYHFLIKRLGRARLKRLPITVAGFLFDVVVYVIAQIKMARGTGVGFW